MIGKESIIPYAPVYKMIRKRRLLCLLLAVIWVSIVARGQEKDSLAVVEHLHEWSQVMALSRRNPAFMQTAYHSSITQAGAHFSYRMGIRCFQPTSPPTFALTSATRCGVEQLIRLVGSVISTSIPPLITTSFIPTSWLTQLGGTWKMNVIHSMEDMPCG